ncbi:MAG: hypothetical protein FIB06_06710 [Betaproteobacteria bacterium]|nr:hypothetical protein [Betaproteobacteria bacterium]
MAGVRKGIGLLLLVAAVSVVGTIAGLKLRGDAQKPEVALAQPVAAVPERDLLRATYDPIHFQPAIATARDEQCLACHREVLDDRVRERSPAGIRADASKAWYQQTTVYAGDQETFHRRHLVTPLARELMNLSCTTCHEGSDPRDEAPGTSATGAAPGAARFTLRKTVDTAATCLKCHGQLNRAVMGLPGAWPDVKATFNNSCLLCHAAIRTNRHRVSYLKADAIEAAGQKDAETCHGCHGGRPWYRLAYSYPRHAWEGMPAEVPAWAKERPTESESRFRTVAVNPK